MTGFEQRWTPGIGDPSLMGWVTVAVYFLVGICCLLVRRIEPVKIDTIDNTTNDANARVYRKFWSILALSLFLLGVNKQLDLQSLFTQTGRDFALASGWYEHRKTVQKIFIGVFGLLAMGTSGWLIYRFKDACHTIKIAVAGFSLLFAFVVIRAASFHNVDFLLRYQFAGVQFNWFMEIGTLIIVGFAAFNYRKKYI